VVVNYQVHESDTKTPSGRRALALDPATLEALREHRRRQAEERAIAEIGDDNDLVFTWPDGRPLHPDLITDWFQRHAKRVVWDQDGRTKVGLPAIRLHDVRHSYATAALAAGIPAKIVSERLGHANVQITLDTYSHVIPGLDEQAAATVARLILEGSAAAPTGVPGSDAANFAAETGDAPHSGEEVRGEDPGELGGGGGVWFQDMVHRCLGSSCTPPTRRCADVAGTAGGHCGPGGGTLQAPGRPGLRGLAPLGARAGHTVRRRRGGRADAPVQAATNQPPAHPARA
jgi:hypothetical protein